MTTKIWRVYACRYDRRYIVEDFIDEEEALEYCQEHDWQLINRVRQKFDLTFELVKIKKIHKSSIKETVASIFIILGFFSLILAGGSESASVIGTFSIVGIISAMLGCDILEVW